MKACVIHLRGSKLMLASNGEVDKVGLKTFLAAQLPNHMMPKRIKLASVSVGHRFKRS